MRAIPTSLLYLSLLVALPALAGTPINESRPLDARGRIEISNVKGRIQVRAWDKPQVKVTGTLGDGVERLRVEGDEENLSVVVEYPQNNWGGKAGPTDLQLMVPLRAELDISSVAADVDVEGVASGELSIDAVSGSVKAVGAPRSADVNSVSGSLDLVLNSADVEAQTVSGDLKLRGRLNGEVSAETVSGGIELVVNNERLRELTANTVSGSIRVTTGLAQRGEIQMETVSGDVLLILPKDLSAQVRGETFSGDLRATGVTIEKRRGPGASFQTRYGSGEGDIRIETFSGNAEVRLQ
ncbi:DUF4097 family beta strand repeat-containing protein [Pseudoxanthomonas indica]|uniref:DUF4097 and DUF4098 domain-containing protein YvlB n=1 Tax=Pseudoxanthomonas indica TaxID=428993 RepID=A0A1T5LJB2_9GAMM|nr:DUF4097 family beta strand repeat-containing protein [Pseudoxanthomonas indica]GGD35902.1 hypothetical protein GCM10007235_04860 [Pseudoxanthomonas indica]SKC76047.1 DUF4097 and DUF4098 domain-containing protein YvlB [Pseudoxanthomonas indica]